MKINDLFEFVEDFMESTEYRAPDSEWVKNGLNLERELTVEDQTIIVIIEPKTFKLKDQTIDFLNLSFVSVDEHGTRIPGATGKNQYGSKSIGAMVNAFKEKILEFDYSALAFIAFDKIDRRMSIYERIVKANIHKFGKAYQPNIKLDDGGKAIVVFKDASEAWQNEFIEWLKKQSKI